jgi:hypothetical protein
MKLKTKEELEKEFDLLKNTNKNVFTITAALDDDATETVTIFLKNADRTIHASVGKLAQGNDPLRAVESCLKSCYIGGDDLSILLNNEEALMSCEIAVVEFLQKRIAVLKKN